MPFVLQPDYSHHALNTSDLEFFLMVAVHPKLDTDGACSLLEIACEIAVKHIIFVRTALKLALTIIARFEADKEVIRRCLGIAQTQVFRIQAQDLTKLALLGQVRGTRQNPTELVD